MMSCYGKLPLPKAFIFPFADGINAPNRTIQPTQTWSIPLLFLKHRLCIFILHYVQPFSLAASFPEGKIKKKLQNEKKRKKKEKKRIEEFAINNHFTP